MPSSDATRCAVATECAEELHRLFESITSVTSAQRTSLLTGVSGGTILAGLLLPGLNVALVGMGAVIGLYNLLLTAEANGYLPLYDGAFSFEMQCDLYCLLGNSGAYTQTVHDAWIAKIRTNPDALHQIVADVLEQAGMVNFQWAAASAPLLAAPDCSGCDCGETTICYVNGTGPETVESGSEFDIVSTLNGNGSQTVWITVSDDCQLDIIDIGDFLNTVGAGQIVYAYNTGAVTPCDYNYTLAGIVVNGPASLPGSIGSISTFVCFSSVTFTMRVRLVKL